MGFFDTVYEILSNLKGNIDNKKDQFSTEKERAYEEVKISMVRKSDTELKGCITSSGSSPKDYGIRQAALEELQNRQDAKKNRKR